MILDPGILALVGSSLLSSLMMLYAVRWGVPILLRWDIASGSDFQLALERRTYLVSTLVRFFLAFQLISLFLFVGTADRISHLFIGAMCAVGTLSAHRFGYPTLFLKIGTFLFAGLWLILDHADQKGYDYPLIRQKYLLLLLLAPVLVAETVLQAQYFHGLKPDLITSCCGSLFGIRSQELALELRYLPPWPMKVLFYALVALTLAAGARFRRSGRGGYLFAVASGFALPISLAAVVAFISSYVYRLPSHHCPFCLLQKEYGYLGYPLYLLLFLASVTGVGVGVLQRYRTVASLKQALPEMQRRLAAVSLSCWSGFLALASYQHLFSNLKMHGP